MRIQAFQSPQTQNRQSFSAHGTFTPPSSVIENLTKDSPRVVEVLGNIMEMWSRMFRHNGAKAGESQFFSPTGEKVSLLTKTVGEKPTEISARFADGSQAHLLRNSEGADVNFDTVAQVYDEIPLTRVYTEGEMHLAQEAERA